MFFTKPAWQRALVVIAGVTMNLLIGILMLVIYTKLGIPRLSGNQVIVSEVAKGSPAELAHLEVGDVVVRVGETTIATSDQFVSVIKADKARQ